MKFHRLLPCIALPACFLMLFGCDGAGSAAEVVHADSFLTVVGAGDEIVPGLGLVWRMDKDEFLNTCQGGESLREDSAAYNPQLVAERADGVSYSPPVQYEVAQPEVTFACTYDFDGQGAFNAAIYTAVFREETLDKLDNAVQGLTGQIEASGLVRPSEVEESAAKTAMEAYPDWEWLSMQGDTRVTLTVRHMALERNEAYILTIVLSPA